MRGFVCALLLAGCAPFGPEPGDTIDPDPGAARLVCDRAWLPEALALLGGAEERVRGTFFELIPGDSTGQIQDALLAAVARGVEVELLLDEEVQATWGVAHDLELGGVGVTLDDDGDLTVHAKSLVADGARALLGSTNGSDPSIDQNHECNVLLEGGAGPAWLERWIDQAIESRGARAGLSDIEATAPRVLADDALLPTLIAAIEGAWDRVDFTLYATTANPTPEAPASRLWDALGAAVQRGAAVSAYVERSDWDASNTARNEAAVERLHELGVVVRWDPWDVVTHSKLWRVDGRVLVLTANPSAAGFEQNRELGVEVVDPAFVDEVEAWWDPLWDAGEAR